MPIETMEFCKTVEPTSNYGGPKEIPRGCSKPLIRTVDDEGRATSPVKKRGVERFITSVSVLDRIVPSKNSHENAFEKELKRLTDLGVLSPAGAGE